MRVRQRGTRTARHDGRKGKSLAAGIAKLLLQNACNRELLHAGTNLRQCASQRLGRHLRGHADAADLTLVLPLAQGLDEIDRGAPLPAGARFQQPLEVSMLDVRGLEAEHLDGAELRELLPKSGPQAGRLDGDPREVANFVHDLRLVPEVGDQDQIARGDHQQCAGARESGEIAYVGQTGEQQAVQVRRGEAVDERGHPTRTRIGHALPPRSAETSPRSASS